MTANADAPRFVHTIRQKSDAEGKLLPIWYWRVQQGSAIVAFGEGRSEQEARAAAQAAEQTCGCSLKAIQSGQC